MSCDGRCCGTCNGLAEIPSRAEHTVRAHRQSTPSEHTVRAHRQSTPSEHTVSSGAPGESLHDTRRLPCAMTAHQENGADTAAIMNTENLRRFVSLPQFSLLPGQTHQNAMGEEILSAFRVVGNATFPDKTWRGFVLGAALPPLWPLGGPLVTTPLFASLDALDVVLAPVEIAGHAAAATYHGVRALLNSETKK
jgi:hypothetical protein